MINLNLMSGTGFNGQGIIDSVTPWVNIGVWLLFGGGGLIMAVKTGLIVVRMGMASDNPELRSELRSSLLWPLISTIILFAIPTIVNAVFAAMGLNLSLSPSATG